MSLKLNGANFVFFLHFRFLSILIETRGFPHPLFLCISPKKKSHRPLQTISSYTPHTHLIHNMKLFTQTIYLYSHTHRQTQTQTQTHTNHSFICNIFRNVSVIHTLRVEYNILLSRNILLRRKILQKLLTSTTNYSTSSILYCTILLN